MRVLHIHAFRSYGGLETLLVTLARYRNCCPEMEPEFALCFGGRLENELVAAGAQVHMLGEYRLRRPLSLWRARRRLAALLRQRRFDAVICHVEWPYALFGAVARSAKVPLALWLHGAVPGPDWVEWWARRTKPDLLLYISNFTAAVRSNLHGDVSAQTIYCPVADPQASEVNGSREAVRRELNTTSDDVVIVQASRLEGFKGHKLHLEALGLLRDLPGWTCWMIGGAQWPPEAAYLEALNLMAAQLGIRERVRFIGERSDVRRLLAAADVYCQPNIGPEPFGISFVEALYAGLPVVTTAMGGAMEVVDETCGIPISLGDAVELARVIRCLVEDPELRRRLGSAGPGRARSLCEPAMQIVKLWRSLESISKPRASSKTTSNGQGLRLPAREELSASPGPATDRLAADNMMPIGGKSLR